MIGHDNTLEKRKAASQSVYSSAQPREGLETVKAARLLGSTLGRSWTNGSRFRPRENCWIF